MSHLEVLEPGGPEVPLVGAGEGGERVVGEVKRLQQRQLEEVRENGGELVVGEIYVCEVIRVQAVVMKEGGRKKEERDVVPLEVVSPDHLDSWSGVLDGQSGLLSIVH